MSNAILEQLEIWYVKEYVGAEISIEQEGIKGAIMALNIYIYTDIRISSIHNLFVFRFRLFFPAVASESHRADKRVLRQKVYGRLDAIYTSCRLVRSTAKRMLPLNLYFL